MPRRNLPDKVRRARKAAEEPEGRPVDPNVIVSGPPGWIVRAVQPARAQKEYRCPGCNHEIKAGTGHVVAWRPEDEAGRRHWHRGCWDSARKRLR